MRFAIYVRVSTTNHVQTQTIEQQIERLRQAIQAQEATLADESIFRDDGYSGASLTRPGLDRLRDAIRNRELDRVLVTAPDRLARNYVHQMVLLEEFEQHGCAVEFLDRPMSQDPHDQLVLHIRGAVAEYERMLITERMRRGRLMKYQAGVLLPWTHPLYGYQVHPDHPRDPRGVTSDPTSAAIVAELFVRYLEPESSLHALVRYLHEQGVPSPTGNAWWGLTTVRGILTNPTYTGQVYTGRMRYHAPKIRRSATHAMGRSHETGEPTPATEWQLVAHIPAIISQEQFDLAQMKLAQNQQFARRNNTTHTYLLRALVSCGQCSWSCIARTRGKYAYYLCYGKGKAVDTGREVPCAARFIPAQQLDDLVWQDLCEVVTHPDSIAQALERAHGGCWLPQDLQARREHLRKGRHSVDQQQERWTEAYLQGIIPLAEFERRRRDLQQKAEALGQMENQLFTQANQHEHIAQLALAMKDFCQRIQQGLGQATFVQKRHLVELLIDRVIVTDEHVEIRYVIPTSPASEQIRFCHLRTDYFSHPFLIGPLGRKIALEEIRGDGMSMLAIGRSLFALPLARHQSHVLHQAGYTLTATGQPLPLQGRMNARTAIDTTPLNEHLLNGRLHRLIRLVSYTGLPFSSCIVATYCHLQHATQHHDGIGVALL